MQFKNIAELNKQIQDAILGLPQELFCEIADKIKEESIKRGLVVNDDNNQVIPVDIRLKPWAITEKQAQYASRLSYALRKALNRIISNYFRDNLIKYTLPLTEAEEEWFRLIYPDGIPKQQAIFERFDTNAVFNSQDWQDFKFVEFNCVGIGCIHFAPTANDIAASLLIPLLKEKIKVQFAQSFDYRKALLEAITSHAKLIGCSQPNVVFVERRESVPGGADELTFLKDYFKAEGIQAFISDPRGLSFKDDQVYYREYPVHVLYRDSQINELISIEQHGGNMSVVKEAFRRNQVISSLAGEFDHKSLCEFFTNPRFSRYFTFMEKLAFRKHFLWTRLIYGRKTHSPKGQLVDLAQYIKDNQDSLVIKPNREYGGEGVTIGHNAATSVWNDAIADALSSPRTFVVQELADIREDEFPTLKEYGQRTLEKNFVVSSFTACGDSIAFLGRASENKVVNISRGGGIIPIFLIT